jgi:hypothetical protein
MPFESELVYRSVYDLNPEVCHGLVVSELASSTGCYSPYTTDLQDEGMKLHKIPAR